MIKIPVLGFHTRDFPPIEHALDDPNGLLAAGGDLSPDRLIDAYSKGIFPWFDAEQPILWWSPSPRAVLFPDQLHISRSLHKTLRKGTYRVTMDQCFEGVIRACSQPRSYTNGTWITEDMIEAYIHLHQLGFAHSVEAWRGEELVGGVYGIALGKVFFGESMFSRATDASKVAFVHLVRQLQAWQFKLVDCQVENPHLVSLGSSNLPRSEFKAILQQHIPPVEQLVRATPGKWSLDWEYCAS